MVPLEYPGDKVVLAFKVVIEHTALNVAGELFGIQAIAPVFEANGGGSVVNVNSIGSMVSGDADGWDSAYAASKGAARAFSRHAALQLAGKGTGVNSVFPGPIETPTLREPLRLLASCAQFQRDPVRLLASCAQSALRKAAEIAHNLQPGVIAIPEIAHNLRPGVIAIPEIAHNLRPGVIARESSPQQCVNCNRFVQARVQSLYRLVRLGSVVGGYLVAPDRSRCKRIETCHLSKQLANICMFATKLLERKPANASRQRGR